MKKVNISIAEYNIALKSDINIDLEEGYDSFISANDSQEVDVHIECFNTLDTSIIQHQKLLFEASNETQKFYSIYQNGTDLCFVIYNQQTYGEIQQIGLLDSNFKNWKLYCSTLENGNINPLKYPMGPIIMQYLTVKSEAVMIHASCAYDGEKGRIFTGFSGAGKSTMSKIWSDAGNLIVNDDRLIIRKINGAFFVYNTPMYYKDIPKKAPLNNIYLISHYPENKIKKLTGAIAVSKVLAFCIQNNYNRSFIQNNLSLLTELSTKVAIYELGFVPNESVINYVLSHE